MCKIFSGEVSPIPTLSSLTSTNKSPLSTFTSPEKVAAPKVVGVISAVPSKDTPPIFLAVAKAVDVAAKAIAIFAVPSKLVPPIVLAVSKAVAVAAFPEVF